MKKFPAKNGFSLIEIMTTISIFVLLIAITIPNFRTYQSNIGLKDSIRTFVGNLRYAQQLAITEQKTYGLIISAATDTYRVVRYDTATTTIKTVILPSDIDFLSVSDFNCDFIRFNSYGAVHESGTVVLINNDGETQTIEIKPSGYVEY